MYEQNAERFDYIYVYCDTPCTESTRLQCSEKKNTYYQRERERSTVSFCILITRAGNLVSFSPFSRGRCDVSGTGRNDVTRYLESTL
mgnify:CR=1 FL=1